ncbi:MAG: hypothetical protein Q9O74_11560 [Planctomycetota bacterium]|nr:hypothetical protein [Planctomycetota bacterium]
MHVARLSSVLSALGVLVVCAGYVQAQDTITYYWDINDTGSDTFLYSGEEVINFKMYALMEPGQVGFAGSIYEIRGGGDYADAGEVVGYYNYLSTYTDHGDLQDNNDILDIESFQLPLMFGLFDPSNPILLYEIEWEVTGSFTIATLTSANHLNNDVYTDIYGTSESYDAVTATATVLIPSPASVLPMVGLLAWRHRR